MKNKKYSVKSGLSAANLLWPKFEVVNDLVFFEWSAPETIDINSWRDRTEIECFYNHVHVLDCFKNNAGLTEEPWWNMEHSDFEAACAFGKLWVEAIASKLKTDFPEKGFMVYYTEQDNPVVRFHQKHAGEPLYLLPEENTNEIECRKVVIYSV